MQTKVRKRCIFFNGNQKVKSVIVNEVTVKSPFITYSSQNPWNFLDMEVIMIKEDDKCLSPFQLKRCMIIRFKKPLRRRSRFANLSIPRYRRWITFSLIVVINLLNRFVMFDVCACMWSAL